MQSASESSKNMDKPLAFPYRALVTGGTGFVGSHLVHRLVNDGVIVHVLVRPDSSLWRIEDVVSELTLWRGDLTDFPSLERCVAGSKPDVVFHLGGGSFGRPWGADLNEIDSIIEVNVKGTLNLLRAIHKSQLHLKRFVRTGGLLEYGDGPLPFDETQRELPASAYPASQAATTMLLNALYQQLTFPVITLRLASVYGPARSADFFLPSLVIHCLEGRDFEMTAGEQMWDLIYVDDVIDAYVKVVQADIDTGEIINIGTGEAFKLREVAEIIVGKTESEKLLKIGALPEQAGKIRHLQCRIGKAKKLLGWSPTTSLDIGLERTIAWYRTHLKQVQLNR